jgi:multiple sugar transport system substrate-binding protein
VSNNLSRRGFLGLGAGTAAAALAGCSGFTPKSTSTAGSTATAGKTLVFRWWGGDARNQAYQAALKIFTQKTGIAVTTQYSGYNGYFDKLNTEFAGGNPPDIFQMDTALVSTYASKNVLIDLSQYVPGTIQTSTLYAQLRTAGTVGGKNYGVASGSGYAPVLYDKTVLDTLKIDAPADSWTWDDFAVITNEISKAWGSGKYGALDASNDDSGAYQPWLRQRGKDLYTSAGVLGFDSADLTEWFTFWAGLRKTGAISPATLLANSGEASGTHPLIAGQVAMTTGWGLAQMQPLTQHTLKIVVVPRSSEGKTGQALNGGVLLSVPQKSTNPVGAAKLINFFLNDDDAIKAMGTTRGLPPSDKAKNLLLPTLTASQQEDVNYGQYVAAQAAKDGLAAAPVSPPGYGDVKTALDSAAKQVAFGKQSISAAVSQFFSDAKTALNNAK